MFLHPMLDDIVQSLTFEIQVSHSKDRINDLFIKKDVFTRVIRMMEKTHENQVCKDTFSHIIAPTTQSYQIFY